MHKKALREGSHCGGAVEYLFVPLDIFSRNIQNRGINSETDAWLAFLSQDDPEVILQLIDIWPEFRPMYEDVYRLCENVERVMEMFSEELRILDRNTVQYMIDEMQAQIDSQKAVIDSLKAEIDGQKVKNQEKDHIITELERHIAGLEKQMKK